MEQDKKKFPTSVKLDPELKAIAQEMKLNLREILEAAIKEEIKKKIICPTCGRHD